MKHILMIRRSAAIFLMVFVLLAPAAVLAAPYGCSTYNSKEYNSAGSCTPPGLGSTSGATDDEGSAGGLVNTGAKLLFILVPSFILLFSALAGRKSRRKRAGGSAEVARAQAQVASKPTTDL